MESYHREIWHPANLAQVERYKQLFEYGRRAFNSFLKIRSKAIFCTRIKDLRNEFTHNLNVAYHQFYRTRELYRLIEQIKVIFTCVLLKEVGLDILEIKKRVGLTRLGEI